MGNKILMVLLIMALLISLPIFSYADLPSGYTELEYIQSSGTQYIDTGFNPDSDTKVIMDVQSVGVNESDTGQSFFGSRDGSDKRFFTFWHRTQNSYYYYFYNTNVNSSSSRIIDRIIVTADKNTLTIGSLVTLRIPTYSDFSLAKPLFLFATNLDGTADYFGINRVFSSQIYDNGTLVRDFIPCVNPSGVVGLWDDVNSVFYDNDGSGTFIAGPVVVPPDPEYSISVSTDGNGSASSNLSVATAGTTVTLSASPNYGYEFSEWQVLQGDIDIVNNQFIMPSSNVSVKAVFVPDGTHSVIVENDGFGVGSANPVRAEQGTRITLSAVPVLGYEFDSWEVVSGAVNISNNQFIMPDSDVVVSAKFKPIVYTITLNQGSNGSATVSQTTGIIGDVITLTASPDEGFSFSHWNIIQGDITVTDNQFVMPASNVVIEPVFLEITAISSGFKYNSGRIDGSYSSHYDVLDINFGDVPAGDYLLNIYHWGGSYNARFGLYYGDKYLAFSSADGLSTTAIEHKGGEFRLYGGLDLVRASTVSADAHVVWISNYGGSGTLDLDNPTTWTFNIEDVVLIPVSKSHLEDFGSVSSLVAFLRDKFDDLISVFGSEESEEDVNEAADELNKEVDDLNNLSGQLDEQKNDLEQQFNFDFKISDELSGQTGNIQLIYTGIFSSFGLFSIFIWLPVVLVVIKKLLRL